MGQGTSGTGGYEVPITRHCFGCGTENACGLSLRPVRDGAVVRATYRPKPAHRGFSRTLHGGLIAALLDEVMAMAVATEVVSLVITVEIGAKYLKPVPMDTELSLESRDVGPRPEDPRRRGAEASLRDGLGTVYATGWGVYQAMPQEMAETFLRNDGPA